MMTRAILAAIAVVFLYGSPSQALTTHVAPPGNSGASQYQEDVPSAAGAVPVTKLPAAGNAGQALPRSVVTQLDLAGTSGRAAAQLANRTAPAAVGVRRSHSSTNLPAARGSHSDTNARATPNVGSQITGAVIGGGGGGLGLVLPGALAGSLIVAIAIALARRRRTR